MLIDVDTVRGFQDILPPLSLKRALVRSVIEEQYRRYGFIPLETPFMELDELFRSDVLEGEDEVVASRFRLKDRGGRNLAIRHEFTFQLARLFKQNPSLPLPFRRYQIGEVLRDEPIGPGKLRQFTQCDADIVGDASIDADAEILALVQDILQKASADSAIYVNNRRLIDALIESVQIRESTSVMRELDKLDKIGEDHVKSNLRKYADTNQILTLFKLLEKDLSFFVANGFDGAAALEELEKKCKRYGVSWKFQPALIRSPNYYTGTIFEVRAPGTAAPCAVGGRYDRLVGKYLQKEIPTVGVSFGLERITSLSSLPIRPVVQAALVSANKATATIALTQELRKAGISCIPFIGLPNASLDTLSQLGIPYVITVDDVAIAKKKWKVMDVQSKEEKFVGIKQLVKMLTR